MGSGIYKTVVVAINHVFNGVRLIIHTFLYWLSNVIEPKTISDVKKAENIIVSADNESSTAKYIAARRESKHIENEAQKLGNSLSNSDLNNANNFLNGL